jgi:hypothetical protein
MKQSSFFCLAAALARRWQNGGHRGLAAVEEICMGTTIDVTDQMGCSRAFGAEFLGGLDLFLVVPRSDFWQFRAVSGRFNVARRCA